MFDDRGRRSMTLGPVEYLVIRFPGNQFRGEIVPALADLVESGTIRTLDLSPRTSSPLTRPGSSVPDFSVPVTSYSPHFV
jgi:hypothetical protein